MNFITLMKHNPLQITDHLLSLAKYTTLLQCPGFSVIVSTIFIMLLGLAACVMLATSAPTPAPTVQRTQIHNATTILDSGVRLNVIMFIFKVAEVFLQCIYWYNNNPLSFIIMLMECTWVSQFGGTVERASQVRFDKVCNTVNFRLPGPFKIVVGTL